MTGQTFLNGRVTLHAGDCREVLHGLDENSVDSCVCDPPYHLTSVAVGWDTMPAKRGKPNITKKSVGFMGKGWDGGDVAFRPETWAEVLRVLKPGAHLVAFGGTRTYHRLACAIEDAGFEIRDAIMWHYGSGFPKSHDVSKQLDAQERNYWLDVCKAIDNTDQRSIVRAWIEYSNHVTDAALQFRKSATETGTNTEKSVSVLAPVLLQINPEKSVANAIIAELKSSEVRLIDAECWRSALSTVGERSTALSVLVGIAEGSPGNLEVTHNIKGSSAPQNAWDWLAASTVSKLKGVEALKTWLGSKPSSNREATAALCAALTDDLKLITLSRSETFRSLDIRSQMDFVSVTGAIITESTAASLISFTAAILKSKGIDRAAGAERDVVGSKLGLPGYANTSTTGRMLPCQDGGNARGYLDVTAPATDSARQWEGWGTALKPATEILVLARKPLSEGTIAANVLCWGTGAINVDGCRISATVADDYGRSAANARGTVNAHDGFDGKSFKMKERDGEYASPQGRWPANVITDGSEEVLAGFPVDVGANGGNGTFRQHAWMDREMSQNIERDKGSAARFFYTAKADADDRIGSKHPTVKPLDLIQYLVRLVTPPKGLVLDCFAGTGTTGEAAWREGFSAVLIEREAEYLADIERRMALCLAGPDERARESIKARLKGKPEDHGPLFEGAAA